jgi:hypothetical protein
MPPAATSMILLKPGILLHLGREIRDIADKELYISGSCYQVLTCNIRFGFRSILKHRTSLEDTRIVVVNFIVLYICLLP